MAAPVVRGWRVWAGPMALLVALILAPLLLLPTRFAPLALTWVLLLVLATWVFLMGSLIGNMAGASTPAVSMVEKAVLCWVARLSPQREHLWLQWAREAHRPLMAHWCLEQGVRLGGAEALFQEGLLYLEGGYGAGGDAAGLERMGRAAERGHPEAAFRYAEALRTGQAGLRDPARAEAWYRRAAQGGFGPAALWLAHAYEAGDGVAADPDKAAQWARAAARLGPRPLSRSLLRHDAGPEDPLIRAGAGLARRVEAAAGRVVVHPVGRRLLLAAAGLLVGGWLALTAFFFLVGASGLFFLPLLMLLPPGLLLAWQAWRLRREGPRRGRDRLLEAAEAGDPEACFRLGQICHTGGPHRPKDDLEAARWFRRAAEAGHRGAMAALAEAYLGGHGVLRDPREAARWAEAARRDP